MLTGTTFYGSSKGVTVNLWKQRLAMCSTAPKAEVLLGGSPLGVKRENEINLVGNDVCDVHVNCVVKYVIQPDGQVRSIDLQDMR